MKTTDNPKENGTRYYLMTPRNMIGSVGPMWSCKQRWKV